MSIAYYRCVASLALALTVVPALASDQAITMWQVRGDTNKVFILGSVHLLRKSDYPIPAVIYQAYDEAETLIECE